MQVGCAARDGHVGHQLEVGTGGRDEQREEHVVRSFESEDAVNAQRR